MKYQGRVKTKSELSLSLFIEVVFLVSFRVRRGINELKQLIVCLDLDKALSEG
ncbi:MAG: hypothetical protein ACRCYE_10800 [Sarcina sp.]